MEQETCCILVLLFVSQFFFCKFSPSHLSGVEVRLQILNSPARWRAEKCAHSELWEITRHCLVRCIVLSVCFYICMLFFHQVFILYLHFSLQFFCLSRLEIYMTCHMYERICLSVSICVWIHVCMYICVWWVYGCYSK